MKVFDKIGQEIRPGCVMAYGHALGRSAGLRIFKILSVVREGEQVKLTAWGIDGEWSHRPATLAGKKVTLFYPDRGVVLLTAQLSPELRQLLGTIPIDPEVT